MLEALGIELVPGPAERLIVDQCVDDQGPGVTLLDVPRSTRGGSPQQAGRLVMRISLVPNVPLTATDLSTRCFLPRLVFANACNAAATDAGLPDDLFAGAPPVRAFVGSIWRVDDAAAETFALAFYDALVQPDEAAPGRPTSWPRGLLGAGGRRGPAGRGPAGVGVLRTVWQSFGDGSVT